MNTQTKPVFARRLGRNAKSATPPPRASAQYARKARYRLRDSLRSWALYERLRVCGRVRVEPEVTVFRRPDGSAGLGGLVHCASVWSCAVCAPAILAGRGQELGRLGTWALEQGYHVSMLTLTVRHAWSHELEVTLRGVARAYSRLISGAPWARFCERTGYIGSVRALELTHGEHGWHPHIHALVIVRNDDELMSDGWDWLANRWAIVVERELGQEHVPDMEHGCVLTVAEHADYLVQMGMDAREVAGDKDKRAAAGHRTPWRIAQDASSSRGTELDRRLWLDYTRATHGRRQLVWSRGLRAASGARHTSDLAILDAAVARADSVILVRLSAEEWKRALARCVVCDLLNAAETGDVRAVARLELAVREAPS